MQDVLIKENIIEENKKLVYYICSKYGNYKDKEDLYQVGMIGLLNAYENYDKEKNVKFSTYAFSYILGEVSKYVRENKSIKISRDIIKLGNKIKEYIQKHKSVKGYAPSYKEISKMLGISEEKVIYAIESSNSIKSLDSNIKDDVNTTLLDITPIKEKVSNDELLDLKEAFKYLDDDEKKLIINRYYNNLTQSEVANILGVNQVYVSRLEKRALCKMKSKMTL